MLSFYINSVKYGYMTIEEVPPRFQEEVQTELEQQTTEQTQA